MTDYHDELHDCDCQHKSTHQSKLPVPHLPAPQPSRRDVLRMGQGALIGMLLSQVPVDPFFQIDPKRIYIALDDHTDYMWATNETIYEQAFVDMIDYYLNLADTTAANPNDFQSRFNMDGTFWVWVYERNRTPAEVQRLIDRIRDGHFSVPMNALVVLHGGTPAEAVLRGMYYAGELERRFNIRLPMAISMENQTLPYGLGSLWAGAGARYSWRGICNCVTQVPNAGDRPYDIYWWVGPDGSRILMKWNSMLIFPGDRNMGGYAEARDPAAVVTYVDTDPAFIARYPYNVIGAFGHGWDDVETYTNLFVTTAQAMTTPTRRVIVSNEEDFFGDFEANYGVTLPTVSVTFGNEWELYCVSLAEVSARVKRALERMRAAEAMATMVTLQDPTFMTGRDVARRTAWMGLGVYWEHNWTANGSVPRVEREDWQRRMMADVENYINPLHDDAALALGTMIITSGANTRFFAFNPLNWTRTDVADFLFNDPPPVHVIDVATGLETPSQLMIINGQQVLRVLAREIPSVGYKVFEVRAGAGAVFPDAATVAGSVIDNGIYRITVADRGALDSVIEVATGREFVRDVNGRRMNDLGPGVGTVTLENIGPVSATLVANSTGILDHTSRLTLFREINRIDIVNVITQNFANTFTWGFGFNLDNPDLWHEEVGAVIRARLLTDGGHYSPRNARYDWLTLNHFADITGTGNVGMTLSNADTYYMGYGNSTPVILDTATPLISVLVGGQVDGAGLGIQNQGGDTEFLQRFALRSHTGFNAANAMRFALEHQNPLVTGIVTATNPIYPESSFSLVTLSNSDVLLWAVKPPETDEEGVVARIWNLTAATQNFTLSINTNTIGSAEQVTHVEVPMRVMDTSTGYLSDSVVGQQLRTYLMRLGPPVTPSPIGAGATNSSGVNAATAVISKRADPPFAVPGDPVRWIITITNPNAQPMTNIEVVDNLPEQLEIQSISSSSGTLTQTGQQVSLRQTALNSSEIITLIIQSRVRPDVSVPYIIPNEATLLLNGVPAGNALAYIASVTNLPETGE